MQYTIEDLPGCRSKVTVTVPAEEIDAAITAAVTMQQRGVALAGFRKGHVPASVVEQRFKGQLYHDAISDLINVHVNQVVTERGVTPLGGFTFTDDVKLVNGAPEISRGTGLTYSLEFECMPVFDLPDYEGIEITQEEHTVTDKEVDAFIAHFLDKYAKLTPASDAEAAVDGQFVNIDFSVSVDGKEVKDLAAQGFDMAVGQATPLPKVDELAKSLKPGESGEREITFPADFFNADLAGKTGKIFMTVHAVKNRVVPTLDEEFLKTLNIKSVEDFRAQAVSIVKHQFDDVYRSAAENELVSKLLKLVDFPLPDSMVKMHLGELISNQQQRAETMGKKFEPSDEEMDKLRAAANERTKSIVLMVSIARKENLEVSQKETEEVLYSIAHKSGLDHKAVFDYYQKTGLIFSLRDSLLADKGIKAAYAKAKVTMVPEKVAEPKAEEKSEN